MPSIDVGVVDPPIPPFIPTPAWPPFAKRDIFESEEVTIDAVPDAVPPFPTVIINDGGEAGLIENKRSTNPPPPPPPPEMMDPDGGIGLLEMTTSPPFPPAPQTEILILEAPRKVDGSNMVVWGVAYTSCLAAGGTGVVDGMGITGGTSGRQGAQQ